MVLSGCSSESAAPGDHSSNEEEENREFAQPITSAPASKVIDPDSPGPTELVVRWGVLPYDTAIGAGAKLEAEIENFVPDALRTRVVLEAAGLDGRAVRRELSELTVPGRSKIEISLAPNDFPLQSDGATSFVVAQLEYENQGALRVVPSTPVYFRFAKGYGSVTLRRMDEVGITADDGLPENPAAPPRGRVFSSNAFADVVPDRVYGHTGFRVRRAGETDSTEREVPVATTASSTASTLSVTACLRWRVQYTDSGQGEDVWVTSGWHWQAASFARGRLRNSVTGGLLWSGQLDWLGCTPALNLTSGTKYQLEADTAGIAAGGITYNVYLQSQTTGQLFNWTAFGTFTPTNSITYIIDSTQSNDAIQVAALAGLTLVAHVFGSLSGAGLGIVPGTYEVRTNVPGGSALGAGDIVLIGADKINGVSHARWKFIVAHEIGHQAQSSAMGTPSLNYDDHATQTACKCTYPETWGNTLHCLQSREQQGVAEFEGFAQAFASRVFNSPSQTNGTLVYYKPFLQDNGQWLNPPMARNIYSAQRWMELHCNSTDRGVEWDWGTFFFNVSNVSSANQTTFSDAFNIYRAACGLTNCSNQNIGFPELDFIALHYYGGNQFDARYQRFRDTGNAHGINH